MSHRNRVRKRLPKITAENFAFFRDVNNRAENSEAGAHTPNAYTGHARAFAHKKKIDNGAQAKYIGEQIITHKSKKGKGKHSVLFWYIDERDSKKIKGRKKDRRPTLIFIDSSGAQHEINRHDLESLAHLYSTKLDAERMGGRHLQDFETRFNLALEMIADKNRLPSIADASFMFHQYLAQTKKE
ncbi:MAG TPA: hypothetical protein VFF13_04775 [archaeon]|nr:hypothetical protein [archaeon]